MQKFVLFAIVGLCLAAYATADVEFGERQTGDRLIDSRRITKPASRNQPMIAKTGFHSTGLITAVSAKNLAGSDATITIIEGGVGFHSVVFYAVSQPGSGLDVQFEAYAL